MITNGIIIFLIFALGGWGNRNGFGGGSGSSGAADNYVLASDFAQISRQLDQGFDRIADSTTQINNGLCNGFYQELVNTNGINTNIASSTAALQSTLCQGFNGVNTAITNGNFGLQNAINGVSSQIASCCCDLREGISGINYNLAMNTNQIQNAMCLNTRDIVDSQNAGTRAILDAITANRIEDKNAQIQAQQNEINKLQLAASQQAQNAYLIDQLGQKCPQPSYLVCNPNGPLNYAVTSAGCGCGYNNGCGCGNY